MQFNITFNTIFEYILKKVVLCIQIRFVSTEKNTRIVSRASCYFLCSLITICIVYFYVLHAVIFCKMQTNLNIPRYYENVNRVLGV